MTRHPDLRPWGNFDPADIVAAFERHDPTRLGRYLATLPAWHAEAVCVGEPVDWWFPRNGQKNTTALEICGRCSVIDQCLADAIADTALDHGIRAGQTSQARKARRRSMNAAVTRG